MKKGILIFFLFLIVTACAGKKFISNEASYLSTGDEVIISLEGNPTTGYDWFLTIDNPSVLREISNWYEADLNVMEGAPAVKNWKMKALTAGSVKLQFFYYRSWEGESNAIQTNFKRIFIR